MNDKSRRKRNDAEPPLTLIGIGASAGGLEAMRGLLPELPASPRVSYVIAQHMDPNHPSLLKELLARMTRMPVNEIHDGDVPQGSAIHVTPPGHNVIYGEDGRLHLEAVSHIGPKPSIDNFFTSLAENAGSHSAGIILSGTGSDGAHGIRAIKAAGGLTFAQDDATAKYNGMPRAAIETGLVDMVLAPERIGPEILALLDNPPTAVPPPPSGKAKTALDQIFQLLLSQTSCDFRNYKLTTLHRRIARRMSVNKTHDIETYLGLLKERPQEIEALFRDILISVTGFFRDGESFNALDDVIRELVRNRHAGDVIRVWVPGVATGEEAYSLAILFDRAILDEASDASYQIFATDIDIDALAIARRGMYLHAQLKNVPPALIDRYFVRKDDTYHVSKRIRERVVFARQDLVRDPPFSRLDMISCRNLLIYFNTKLQEQVIALFHYVLRPGGLLFLGKSESVGNHTALFEAVAKGPRVFRALSGTTALPPEFALLGTRTPTLSNDTSRGPEPDGERSLAERLERTLLKHLMPAGVVVDERGHVLHLNGDVSGFLRLPSGRMDTHILNLVRDDLRIDLRTLLHRAKREGNAISQRLRLTVNKQDVLMIIRVIALEAVRDEGRAFLVAFQLSGLETCSDGESVASLGREDPRIQELEQELIATREHLQTTIEELETSNEELQSTNEELQSANEELQSANEELETSNEELQSTNEELATVNEELQVKSSELASANSDLESILAVMGSPLLVVDNRLRVTRYTQAATQLFNIKASDIGEVITTLDCRVPLPNLRSNILGVIQEEREYRDKISIGSQLWQMRILPSYSEQRRAVGAVLIFDELTADRMVFDGMFEQQALLGVIMDAVRVPLIVTSEQGNIVGFNHPAENLFGYLRDEVINRNIRILMPPPFTEHHDDYIRRFLETGEKRMVGIGRQVTGLHKDGSRLTLQLDLHEVIQNGTRLFVGRLTRPE